MRRMLCFLAVVAQSLACGYRLPLWEGDVDDVSPIEREAISKCGDGKLTVSGAKRLHRRPYLQNVTQTSAVVAWAAWPEDMWVEIKKDDTVVDTARARFGGDPKGVDKKLRHRADNQSVPAAYFYVQRADLDGLEPKTLYCYQVLAKDGPLTEPAPLLTAAPPGQDEPVKFVMLGDTGSGNAAAQTIAKRITETPFDFLVFLGDVAYEQGSAGQLQSAFFEIYRDYLSYVPSFLTIGNHERRTRNGKPYLEAFILPGKELYYSFDWGDVHFVAIDTTGNYRAQVEWLDRDLEANHLPFVIVFGHHPMYSNSIRGPNLALRHRFWPILWRHRVTMLITGHEHHYERFAPRDGVIHVVSGGGGGRLTRLYSKAATVRQRTVHHYLAFEVTKDKLTMRAIDIAGEEFDKLEIAAPARSDAHARVTH